MSRPGGGGGGGGPGVGAGSAGTCFSGGSGSGGTYFAIGASTFTNDAGGRGGAGSEGAIVGVTPATPQSCAGAGNPNGNTNPSLPDDAQFNGTGGVLIVFVEGTITTSGASVKHFRANGTYGRQMIEQGQAGTGILPFGGGTGGGIVIVVNNDPTSITDNMEALGGIVVSGGPSPSLQSGGNGATVRTSFGDL
jgi:hypothetical protein